LGFDFLILEDGEKAAGGAGTVCGIEAAGWVDATVIIPFPIQMDLWYECIEMV
jgi:hypothetical protein